jgi:hypothetical protein
VCLDLPFDYGLNELQLGRDSLYIYDRKRRMFLAISPQHPAYSTLAQAAGPMKDCVYFHAAVSGDGKTLTMQQPALRTQTWPAE